MHTKPTICITKWEATLEFGGQVRRGYPVELATCFVDVPALPVRRRVSVEEFEADMARVRR